MRAAPKKQPLCHYLKNGKPLCGVPIEAAYTTRVTMAVTCRKCVERLLG